MLLGIGTDLLCLRRFFDICQRRGADRVARKILSEREFAEYLKKGKDGWRYLASRFSVKEAAYKAMYP
ncbi:hypothetical protein ROZALSC1DRAFT_197, partial [Rozella allomycis CSF55]